MKAVILAAGRGTRMKHLTENQPKPMLDIGKQRILENIIFEIHRSGVEEFIVVIGYHANIIQDHFKDGSAYGFHIGYVYQEELNGTGGAVKLTRNNVGEDPFLLTFGDIITSPQNYSRIIQTYQQAPCDGLIGVNEVEDPFAGAAVCFDTPDNRIFDIIEKPPKGTSPSKWNNSGLFVFHPKMFDSVDRIELSPRGEYELTDAIRAMVKDRLDVRALPLKGFWGDIGSPEDVNTLRKLLENNFVSLTDISKNINLREVEDTVNE